MVRAHAIVVACVMLSVLSGGGPIAAQVVLDDGFEDLPVDVAWVDGGTYGNWRAVYHGYGRTRVMEQDGSRVLSQAPMTSERPDETHASLVTSVQSFGDVHVRARVRTVRPLRSPPNPWEVAWLLWHYVDDGHFYYIALKPNGWELGKVDASRRDPDGPACVWPAYENCRYEGGQRYLATGSVPRFVTGPWYRIEVRQIGTAMAIAVDGVPLVAFTDTVNPYRAGAIGLYNEDAHVQFDDVSVSLLGPVPAVPTPSVSLSRSGAHQLGTAIGVRYAPGRRPLPASYDVYYRAAPWTGSSFSALRLLRGRTGATALSFSGSRGWTYCFFVRARDTLGHTSAFSAARCTAIPLDDRSLLGAGTWTRRLSSPYLFGTASATAAAGRALSVRVGDVRNVALIATRCARCGVADVYLGSTRLRRVDLRASATRVRQLIPVAGFSSARSGTLRVVSRASGSRTVVVEGFGVYRGAPADGVGAPTPVPGAVPAPEPVPVAGSLPDVEPVPVAGILPQVEPAPADDTPVVPGALDPVMGREPPLPPVPPEIGPIPAPMPPAGRPVSVVPRSIQRAAVHSAAARSLDAGPPDVARRAFRPARTMLTGAPRSDARARDGGRDGGRRRIDRRDPRRHR